MNAAALSLQWWSTFWSAASFFAILFTGTVALFGLWKASRERRDDRAVALIARYNSQRENYQAYTRLMPWGNPDTDRAFVRESLVPLTDPARKTHFTITVGPHSMTKPLYTPSEILSAARDLYNWLTECNMLYRRNLANRHLVLEVSALTAIRYIYIFEPVWTELQAIIGVDMREIRRLALRGQWYARRDVSREKYDKVLNYCFTAF